jgi:hypothetical protein
MMKIKYNHAECEGEHFGIRLLSHEIKVVTTSAQAEQAVCNGL